MPAKKKTAKKTAKMRDLKPSKDAKGGALRRTLGSSKGKHHY